jgi:hypothetical protein
MSNATHDETAVRDSVARNRHLVLVEKLPGRAVAAATRVDGRLLVVVDNRKANAWAHARELLGDMAA